MNTGNGTYINTPSSAKVAREAKLKMPTPLSKRSSVFTSHPPNVPVSFNYDSNFASAFVRAQISQPVSSNMLQQQSGGYSSANVMANSQGNMKAYKGLNNTGNSRGSTFRAPSGVSFSIGSGSSTGTPASQPSTPVLDQSFKVRILSGLRIKICLITLTQVHHTLLLENNFVQQA